MSAKIPATTDELMIAIKGLVKQMNTRFDSVDNRFTSLKKEMNQRFDEVVIHFDKQEQKFFNWRSEIHDLIDKKFTSKAKKHDEEIAVLNNRTVEIRKRLDKLEPVVFAS